MLFGDVIYIYIYTEFVFGSIMGEEEEAAEAGDPLRSLKETPYA